MGWRSQKEFQFKSKPIGMINFICKQNKRKWGIFLNTSHKHSKQKMLDCKRIGE